MRETDALTGVTSYAYDGLGNRVRETDARNHSTYSHYDKLGRVRWIRDAENHVTETTYTAFGDVETVKRYASRATNTASADVLPAVSAHPSDATTRFDYDRMGRVTKTTDAESFTERYTLDAFGQRIAVYNKLGGIAYNSFDERGLLIEETVMIPTWDQWDAMISSSVTTRFEHDARGNLIRRIEAAGLAEQRTTEYVFDKLDRLTETRGNAVVWYDTATYSAQAAAAPTEKLSYDRRHNVIEQIDARGARSLFWYDRLDRKIAQIDGAGTLSTWTYDAVGNVDTAKVYATRLAHPADAGGVPPGVPAGELRETGHTYDALNRLKTSTIRNLRTGSWNGSAYQHRIGAVTTSYEYDAMSNVLKVVNGANEAIYAIFDKLGRKTRQVDGEGYAMAWTYDAEGNVGEERRWATKATNFGLGWLTDPSAHADDRITAFSYDRMGRRISETRRNVFAHTVEGTGALTVTASDSIVRYGYNGLGQVTRRQEAAGDVTRYEHDSHGRLITEIKAGYHDDSGSYIEPKLDYRYNGLGDLTLTVHTATAGGAARIVRYTYGTGGRLSAMTDASGATFTYRYDRAGDQVLQSWNRHRSDGTAQTEGVLYVRDMLGRVTSQATGFFNASWQKGDAQRTEYNAYGEVGRRGINGFQENFVYDAAGQLAASNAGDGVWRYYVSDGAGRRTLTIENQGRGDLVARTVTDALGIAGASVQLLESNYVAGLATTMAVHDRRGQQIETRQPQRQLGPSDRRSLSSKVAYNAFGEAVSERDANLIETNHSYNTMGRRIETVQAQVIVQRADGTEALLRPVQRFFYDASGRLVGSEDANGHRSARHLLAGTGFNGSAALVTAEFHADSGMSRWGYDRFGDRRWALDENVRATNMTYDALGRVTEVRRSSGAWDAYSYDVLGQQLWHWNSLGGVGDAATTDYDHQGRVVRARAMGGDVTATGYVWDGSASVTGLGAVGGWIETTTFANGRATAEHSGVFGQAILSRDMGNRDTHYSYNLGGRQVGRTGDGETLATSWYDSGLVAGTMRSNTQSGAVLATTTYAYDAAGRRTLERLVQGGVTYQNASVTYDALGRMQSWSEAGGGVPAASMDWRYDAVGNIRRTRASRALLDANGTVMGSGAEGDRWFRYDARNRLVIDGGRLEGGAIVRGDGTETLYDVAGQRMWSARDVWLTAQVLVYEQNSDGGGMVIVEPGGEWVTRTAPYQGERRDTYIYTPDGALHVVATHDEGYTDDGNGNAARNGSLTTPAGRAEYEYDAMGRRTRQIDRDELGRIVYDQAIVYDRGRVREEVVNRIEGGVAVRTVTSNDYGLNGNEYLGEVARATVESTRGGQTSTSVTTNSYGWRQGAELLSAGVSGASASTTSYARGADGRLESVRVADGLPRTVTFVNDANGQAVRRDEAYGSDPRGGHERWYRFAGVEIGHVGNNAAAPADYASSLDLRERVPVAGPLGTPDPRYDARFARTVDRITSYDGGSRAGTYTVRGGDTLAGIAAQLWGDAGLWYKLARANGLSGDAGLAAGRVLSVPAGVVRSAYNAATLTPFDPADTLGDLSPSAPQPRARGGGQKCGTFGKILLVAVAVAVAAVVGPAIIGAPAVLGANGAVAVAGTGLSGALGAAGGTIAAGAIAGVAGSIASQGVGLATGIQNSFSWKGVALAGLSGGVGGGLGGGTLIGGIGNRTASGIANGAVRGVLSNAATQGLAMATGLQSKFDWAGVAAAGAVGGSVGGVSARFGVDWQGGGFGDRLSQAATAAAGAIAGAATRSALTGTSFGDNVLAVLPDVVGATIGQALAGAVAGRGHSALSEIVTAQTGPRDSMGRLIAVRSDARSDIVVRAPLQRRKTEKQGLFGFIHKSLGGIDRFFGSLFRSANAAMNQISLTISQASDRYAQGQMLAAEANLALSRQVIGGYVALDRSYQVTTRLGGTIKAMGGASETYSGVTMGAASPATGPFAVVVGPAGALIATHGADTMQSGIRTAWTGVEVDTMTSDAVQGFGVSRGTANLVDAGIGVAGSITAVAAAAPRGAVATGSVYVGRTYGGGAYGRLTAQKGFIERHHTPADSVSPYTTHSGPAIQMDYADHLLTSSHGGSLPSALYRSEVKQLIDAGNMRGAMAKEIWDVRRVSVQSSGSPTKYNLATREMLDYAYAQRYLLKGP